MLLMSDATPSPVSLADFAAVFHQSTECPRKETIHAGRFPLNSHRRSDLDI